MIDMAFTLADDTCDTVTIGTHVPRVAPPPPAHGTPVPTAPEPPPWQHEAACRGMGTELFYPTKPDGREPGIERWRYNPGRQVCAACGVREDCLADALATGELHGLRGGYDPLERSWMLKRRRP